MRNNFIGTFNLKNQNDKQFIYSSQLYGTFFNIYAQPILNEDETELITLRLFLINYKGHLNLGLLKTENESQSIELNEGKIEFKVHVRALEAINGEDESVNLNFNGIRLDQIKEWIVDRELHPIENDMRSGESTLNQVFDTEFFDRDGIFFTERVNPENSRSPGPRCKTSYLEVISQ